MQIYRFTARSFGKSSSLTYKNTCKYVFGIHKRKILTAYIQAVRIFICAPDRTRTYTAMNHQILSLARLPISPQAHNAMQS